MTAVKKYTQNVCKNTKIRWIAWTNTLYLHLLTCIDIDTNNCILHRFRLLSPVANCNNMYSKNEEKKLASITVKKKIEVTNWTCHLDIKHTSFMQPKLLSCVQTHVCSARTCILYDCCPIYTIPSLVIKTDTMNLILIWNDLRLQWR